jgi:hypothetical protein
MLLETLSPGIQAHWKRLPAFFFLNRLSSLGSRIREEDQNPNLRHWVPMAVMDDPAAKESPMDVFNISAGQAPKATESGSVNRDEALVPGSRSKAGRRVEDSFSASSTARQVEGLKQKLGAEAAAGSDLRPDLIGKFRALMAVGELDTSGSAEQAAEGLLSESGRKS